MGFNKYSILLTTRFLLLLITLVALTKLITTSGYHAATLLVVLAFTFQVAELLRFISKTNTELARFLKAAQYADFSQRFDLNTLGSGFDDLGNTFTEILTRFQSSNAEKEEELRHLKAMVEHVPVPIMSIQNDGRVTLWNNSARRLFGAHHIGHMKDLVKFGSEFAINLTNINAGEQRLISINIDGMDHQLSVSATQILMAEKQEMIVSMQNIQSELDSAQLQAWQELVRVLTHEIMNSITPVASLAKTAVDLVEDAKQKNNDNAELREELDDIASAAQTVARRSEGLIQFVSSYRRLTHLPPPNKSQIKISGLFMQVIALATQHWVKRGITLTTSIQPEELDVNIDVDMLEQLLINLLQNAEHALTNISNPQVDLRALINPRGHVVIEVDDNGNGINTDIAKNIFVPFFTTKRDGSGVGLALTRQIMIAHGGSVTLSQSQLGGAQFNLTF